MPGDAFGHAAGDRNSEYVNVAVVVSFEGDQFSIRGYYGVPFRSNARGEPGGFTALPRYSPQIAGVDKYNVGCRKRRIAEEELFGRLCVKRCDSGQD